MSIPEVKGHGKSASLHPDSTGEGGRGGRLGPQKGCQPQRTCVNCLLYTENKETLIGLSVPASLSLTVLGCLWTIRSPELLEPSGMKISISLVSPLLPCFVQSTKT